jgi:hypothetical protein
LQPGTHPLGIRIRGDNSINTTDLIIVASLGPPIKLDFLLISADLLQLAHAIFEP